MTLPVWLRRIDPGLVLILLAVLLLRLHLASTEPYVHDEDHTSIPLSKTISLAPGNLHLPLRGENHGALPAYFVKASSSLFGTTPLAYRLIHILLAICTIVMIYRLTRQWYGAPAARWAAALLAFNEYYLAVSSRATAHVPYLFFVAAAIYAFSRFLAAQRPVYLYAAGAAAGLAFYCKEHAALLLPLFLLALLRARYRPWLRSPHVYLAAAVFVVIIGADVYWNATTNRETARATYGTVPVGYATYRSHLERVGGIGLSPYPAMFYARPAIKSLYLDITGSELRDETAEYPSMNPALGLLLLGAVLITTFRPPGRDAFTGFLLLVFWGVFSFFTFIRPGNPPGRLDPVSWIWVEATMIPAVILTGARLASAPEKWRAVAWAFGGGVLLYASGSTALALVDDGLRAVREAIAAARFALDGSGTNLLNGLRHQPLQALAISAAVPTWNWSSKLTRRFTRRRRRRASPVR